MAERSKHETSFIDQFTRKLCVEWAQICVEEGHLPGKDFSDEAIAKDPYKAYAMSKGWFSKRLPRTLTAGGWDRAVAWLKK